MRWKGDQALTGWEHPAAARYLEEVLRKFEVVNTQAARTPLPPALTIDPRDAPQDVHGRVFMEGIRLEVLSGFYRFIRISISSSNRVSRSKIVDVTRVS